MSRSKRMIGRLASLLLAATVGACQSAGVGNDLPRPSDHLQPAKIDATYRVEDRTRPPEATARSARASGDEGLRVGSDRQQQPQRGTYDLAQAAQTTQPGATGGAAPGQAAGAQQGANVAEVGQKLSDPTSDVWALFTEFDWNFVQGKATTKYRHAQDILFQPVLPIPLIQNLKLISRPVVPFASVPLPDGKGGFDRKTGLGDIQVPLLFVPKGLSVGGFDVTYGGGPTFVFPTATSDDLGSDRWEAGPALVGVFKNQKITVGALGQYWWSYAGGNPVTSHGSLLYFGWYNLPNAWQIGTNPTITYDHEATSDNKWSVPIGLTVAKTTRIGKVPVKFQFGAQYFVINQEDYGPRFLLKLNIIPVIPALIKEPVFGG
jgi:hypothetical protein